MIFKDEKSALEKKQEIKVFLNRYIPENDYITAIYSHVQNNTFSISLELTSSSALNLVKEAMGEFKSLNQDLNNAFKDIKFITKENSEIASLKSEVRALKTIIEDFKKSKTIQELVDDEYSLKVFTIDVDFIVLSKEKVAFGEASMFDDLVETGILEEAHNSPYTVETIDADCHEPFMNNKVITSEKIYDITYQEFLNAKTSK